MHSALLYLVTIVIWGSTWIAIKFQLGSVDALVSIAHRMALAALLSVALVLLREGFAKLSPRDHARVFLQGLCLFSGNYVFIYAATASLSTGLVAVVFSTMVILNAIGGALFLNLPIRPAVFVGGLLGLFGMALLFLPELGTLSWEDESLRAVLICFVGTLCASGGNMIAAGNLRRGLPVLSCNCWGMLYGCLCLYVAALLLGKSLAVPLEPVYLGSLVYLAVFGTVLAFWAYISLIGRIGADRAAYTTLIFPLVALLISTVVEGYLWTPWAFGGLALILGGNWLAMRGVRG
ncbi:MAG: drug/metabolite transporter (DMT)-like permease [Halieaceae bacterium]|jgi:drug/metabolite transporter (DMT)-like permease